MDYCFSNPWSLILFKPEIELDDADEEEDAETFLDVISQNHIDMLRTTSAFKRYIIRGHKIFHVGSSMESLVESNPDAVHDFLHDTEFVFEQVVPSLNRYHQYRRQVQLAKICLMRLLAMPRKADYRRSASELLCDVLDRNFVQSDRFDDLLRIIKYALDSLSSHLMFSDSFTWMR